MTKRNKRIADILQRHRIRASPFLREVLEGRTNFPYMMIWRRAGELQAWSLSVVDRSIIESYKPLAIWNLETGKLVATSAYV